MAPRRGPASRGWRSLAGLAAVSLGTAACGGQKASAHASDGQALHADAVRASRSIADSLVNELQSKLTESNGSYQQCTNSQRTFYSSTVTATGPAGISVGHYQSQIIPLLRRLGWAVTVVDVARLHTFGGPVRHPIDRIRDGSLFGAVNILKIADKTETIVFVNTNCFTLAKSP
jgi:hypothetical protein